jgi:lantibiotic transport system ATP-binding protein
MIFAQKFESTIFTYITMNKSIELIIETKNLDFRFNSQQEVLKNLSLKVEKGSIYGFLGPNGAGKTTTIRVLLGLFGEPGNSVQLFGMNLADNRSEIFSRIGSLIEQPSLYEHISGYDNLDITRAVRKVSKKKIPEVLELVQLSNASKKKVSSYSLGMKQRLGLAIALIAEPDLLILDEPVNGLDPKGIVEIRELLRGINKEFGTTIFVSSHILSEIEKIVTHIGIINMGELIYQGTIDELRELKAYKPELSIETNDNQRAFELLKQSYPISQTGNVLIIACASKDQVAQIIRDLVMNNLNIYKAVIENNDLEQLFLGMTKNYVVK